MKAAVWYGYKDIRVLDMPLPELRPGSARIRVDYAGICGTDRHEYVGPNFIPVSKPHRLTGRLAPLIMGHEFAGVITDVGDGVTGWRAGDRVTANGTLCCGVCAACKSGHYNVCEKLGFIGVGEDGVFAEYVCVDARRLFKIPDNVTQRQAILAEPLACGIHATGLLGDIRGATVAVIGTGMIGLACFFAAKSAGAGQVLVAGRRETRAELVEKYGGIYCDLTADSLAAALRRWNGGELAQVV
jgi:(R,R)-butanediol dehydrogenase/meso-butanediol dehydrogenase/diacetyl reductase